MNMANFLQDKCIKEFEPKEPISFGVKESVHPTHVYFSSGVFSNWTASHFTHSSYVGILEGNTGDIFKFRHIEQWMMASKALLMFDYPAFEYIMTRHSPKLIKYLGRQVKNYKAIKWDTFKMHMVVEGLTQKFLQNEEMLECLKKTEGRKIVEGTLDPIWGCGIYYKSAKILNEKNWTGTNLLGQCLNKTYDRIFLGDKSHDEETKRLSTVWSEIKGKSRLYKEHIANIQYDEKLDHAEDSFLNELDEF